MNFFRSSGFFCEEIAGVGACPTVPLVHVVQILCCKISKWKGFQLTVAIGPNEYISKTFDFVTYISCRFRCKNWASPSRPPLGRNSAHKSTRRKERAIRSRNWLDFQMDRRPPQRRWLPLWLGCRDDATSWRRSSRWVKRAKSKTRRNLWVGKIIKIIKLNIL